MEISIGSFDLVSAFEALDVLRGTGGAVTGTSSTLSIVTGNGAGARTVSLTGDFSYSGAPNAQGEFAQRPSQGTVTSIRVGTDDPTVITIFRLITIR